MNLNVILNINLKPKTASLHSRRIKGWGWGKRKRIREGGGGRGKETSFPPPFPEFSPNSLPPLPLLYTGATQATRRQAWTFRYLHHPWNCAWPKIEPWGISTQPYSFVAVGDKRLKIANKFNSPFLEFIIYNITKIVRALYVANIWPLNKKYVNQCSLFYVFE